MKDLEAKIRAGNLREEEIDEIRKLEDPRSRRKFISTLGKIIGLTSVLSACKECDPDPFTPIGGNATIGIYDFYQGPATSGSVTTDKGNYGISGGISSIEYNTSTRCTINVPGNVVWEANIRDLNNYIMVPLNWEQFFAHNNIGGNGTNKFTAAINTYIDGDPNDPDYSIVLQRLAVVGDGRANNLVNSASAANFIIHLKSNRNGHSETVGGGVISKCEIYLRNSADQFYTLAIAADEEIAEGLTHTGDVPLGIIPVEGQNSCIAGAHQGWQPIDKLIMDALYSRKSSTFYGNGTEKEG